MTKRNVLLHCLLLLFPLSSLLAQPRVAVVGAGLAGLTTAYRLQQMGIEAEVFEARDRAGGRVFTYHSGTTREELGGKNLGDGGEALNIKALAHELGLKVETHTRPLTRRYLADDIYEGLQQGPRPTAKLYDTYLAKADTSSNVFEVFEWFFSAHADLLKVYTSVAALYEGSIPQLLDAQFATVFWHFYEDDYAKAQLESGNRPDHVWELIEGGNDQLIGALCAALQRPIHYRSPLRKISTDGCQRIKLQFDDRLETFDIVILAIPCSTLCDVDIEPGLIPQDQMSAINNLQYGTIGKILFHVGSQKQPPTSFVFDDNLVTWFNEDRTILTLYLGGDKGIFDVTDIDSFNTTVTRYKDVIEVLHPGLQVVGEPIPCCWTLDPYSNGSYSNFGVGQFKLLNQRESAFGEEVKTVFRPVQERLFFAGEHTALVNYATMEGAVESGERTARMVINSMSKTK